MSPLWKKLNYRDHSPMAVIAAPDSFESELENITNSQVIRTFRGKKNLTFVLTFVRKKSEIRRFADTVAKATAGDAVVWFAYPKKTSKNFAGDISRDDGWEPLGRHGFEGVRQVAIDDDWSALRFRRVEFIRSLTRDPKRRLT